MKKELTKRQLQAIESKEKIRRKALELFSQTDYEEVSISDICNSAGMATGNFYNYFTSKEDLIMSLYHSFDEFAEENLSQKRYDSNIEALKDALFSLAKSADSYGVKLSAQMLRIQLKSHKKYSNNKARFFDSYIDNLVRDAIEKREIIADYPADSISSLLLIITRGNLYDWAMSNDEYSITEKVLHDIEMVLSEMLAY